MDGVIKKRIETILSSLDKNEREEYLKNMLKEIENSNNKDKDQLMKVINATILELEVTIGNAKNEELLETMQKTNPDLKRLKLIKTSKFDNDSYKDITYLYLQNEKGETEMIEITDENALRNFIIDKQDSKYTAEDIFYYFQRHISRELDFKDPEKEQDNKAVIEDEVIKDIEMKKVEQYKQEQQLHEDIEVSVDYSGERIYRIGTVVLKFETKANKRELIVLETGKDMNQENTEEEQKQAERDQNYINNNVKGEVFETSDTTDNLDETSGEQEKTEDELSESEKLEYLTKTIDYEITNVEFEEMVERVLINEEPCDLETHAKIIVFINEVMKRAEEKEAADENFEEEQKYINYYVESVQPYYDAYLNGEESIYKLSEKELEIMEKYTEQRRREGTKIRTRVNPEEKKSA